MKYVYFIFAMVFAVGLAFGEAGPQGSQKDAPTSYKIVGVIDGDTLRIEAPWLPPKLGNTLLLRIEGIDTPEKGHLAKCAQEAADSLKAKYFLMGEIKNAKVKEVVLKKWDKYGGRVIGDVILDGVPLSKKMIASGNARVYNGGKKESWC